jgi:hypothetical protein
VAVSTFTGLGLAVTDWYVAVSRQAFPQPLAVLVQVACLGAVWWSLHSNYLLGGLFYAPLVITLVSRAGELVTDDYLLQVSPDAPPCRYVLVTGMYLPDTLERLPV